MSIDVSKLQISVAEGERWRRTLNITVPSEVLRAERRAAVKKLSSSIQLPGFRVGKVPASMIEKRFGPSIEQELVDRVIRDAFRQAVEDRALQPISEGEVGDISYEPESDLKFAVSFDILPQVELKQTGGFTLTRPSVQVGNEEVEKVLTRIREQMGLWTPIEEGGQPETGELVSVHIQRLDHPGEEPFPYEFVLGESQAIPEVETAIASLSVGASEEFTIPLADHDHDHDHDHAGHDHDHHHDHPTTQALRITLDSRKKRELPEMNDDFARTAGDFQTVDDLKARIREDLHEEAGREAESQLRGALLNEILGANPFEVPESMIDRFILSALNNPKELPPERFAEAKEELRHHADTAVKRHLVVEKLVEQAGLKVTENEVDAKVEELASKGKTTVNELYARLQRSGQLERIERELLEAKVFDLLREQSVIRDAT
jgi:trigger factor